MQNSRLRAMVVPREHGAWGMLLVPLATGAVVATPYGVHGFALALFITAALALFWLRTPVEAWLGTSAIKVHTQEERRTALNVIVLLTAVGIASIAALLAYGYSRGLLVVGAVAALSFAVQAGVKRLGRRGRMPAQIIGAVGLTSTAASAFYVATGQLSVVAIALWVANWLFAGNQIHFVQLRIRSGRAVTLREKFLRGRTFLTGEALLFLGVILLSLAGLFPKLTVLALVPALIRGAAWFLRKQRPLDVHRLGFSELFQSIAFGVLLCTAFLV